MAHAIRMHETGGPEVLRWEEVTVGDAGPGTGSSSGTKRSASISPTPTSARDSIRFRCRTASASKRPASSRPSVRASTNVVVGDRVTYTGFINTLGAYSTERVIPAAPLIKLPAGISCETAAAMTMRGLTSAYLMRRIWPLKSGDTILLHAAAGGVGLIVSQWAKLLGLSVIGTVSSEAKADVARKHGCDHVILYTREDVAKRVRELTNGAGVAVAYDSVGKDTFAGSIDSLKKRGLLVCVGTASGPVPPIDATQLAIKGSVYVTRPALADYIADPAEKTRARAASSSNTSPPGRIRIEINQRYELQDAAQAHRDLEARKTTGSSIFVDLTSERNIEGARTT